MGAQLLDSLNATVEAVAEKHAEVWNDPTKLELVSTLLLSIGTQLVLDKEEDVQSARVIAGLAYFLQKRIEFLNRVPYEDVNKFLELLLADEHTPVKYLRKNIPCSSWV